MADRVTERFEEFRRQFLDGGLADPRAALDGFEGDERAELALLIEHFLVELPRREWDEGEFRRSGASLLSERVVAALTDDAAIESERLKDLRDRAEIARPSLVERLADALEVPEESERIGFYYHHMEQGTLPIEGISERVFEALAGVLQVGVDRLRQAAARSQRDPGPGEPVFARSVTGTNPGLEAALAEDLKPEPPGNPGKVDGLFTSN